MEPIKQVISELTGLTNHLTIDAHLISELTTAKHVFVYGAGRSGLALQMFAMRLAQMDKPAIVVGQITAPPIHVEDLLLVASGSGQTMQTKHFVETAKAVGAKTILLSTKADSPIADLTDQTIVLGGKAKYADQKSSQQPLGAAFEQLVFLYLEAVVLDLMSAWHLDETDLAKHHANLE